jgi:uracil-DNA glycosylase family 4
VTLLATGAAGQPERERLADIAADVVVCRKCPRLVAWREMAARQKVARYAAEPYWGRPVPGFGDPDARVLLVGLAPAANGGNRTGRVFTGDNSGNFLFPALFRAGFANQPTSVHVTDGLRLHDLYVASVNRSAPPDNKPTPDERDRCLPYLVREMVSLQRARVIVALGAYAWDGALRALAVLGSRVVPAPRFGHGQEARVGEYALVGCFHVSQQNTFTRKLTPGMLDAVLERARALADEHSMEGPRPG